MNPSGDGMHERYEGVDAEFLNSDTWAQDGTATECPKCGYPSPPSNLRCPRCNALLLTGCSGSCASCGARTCARRR